MGTFVHIGKERGREVKRERGIREGERKRGREIKIERGTWREEEKNRGNEGEGQRDRGRE